MRRRSAGVRYAIAIAVLAGTIGAATAFAGEVAVPEIDGEPREGETLFASIDAPEPDFWRWERCEESEAVCLGFTRGKGPWFPIEGADEDSYTLQSADVGEFVRVVAVYCPEGCFDERESDPVGPIEPAAGTPPTPGGPPPPVARVSANLIPVSGEILVKLPGTDFFIPISQATQIPMGTVVDARNGHVDVVTAKNKQGTTQTGEFWAGVFKVTQGGDPLVTKLELVGAGAPAGREAAERRRRGRKLWGRGKCRCRTRGRHSAGTVRGTWWLTKEKRKGTVTRVKRGKVRVRDFGKRKRILVRAGERYLAKPGD